MKEVDTPQAVLRVAEESQPGWAARSGFWAVVFGQYAADDILVDIDTEGKRDLLGDAPAAKARVPSFHLDDHGDQLRRRPFGAWLTTLFGSEQ